MKVPFADVGIADKPYETDVLAAAQRVLTSGQYIGGAEVEAFEREFAEFCGAAEAVAVRTGTDALGFALRAAGVGPGDEVVTVPMTFVATAEAISHVGATPVFVDVHPDTALMDVERVASVLTGRTRAVLPVHLYGQPVEMDALMALARARDLVVIEDACQAHGAEYRGRRAGALGDLAAFSFYPSKNLGACGEGGIVTARRSGAAGPVRRLRDHGQSVRYQHEVIGYNGRLDALQAAILRVKLRWLDAANAQRRKVALLYEQALADVPGVELPSHPAHVLPVWHLYVIRVEHRDRLRERLAVDGIDTGLHYPIPVHLQPAYRHLGHRPGDFPTAERLAARILSLPFFPDMSEAQVARVAAAVRSAL
ncbi:MAG: DegT/DnrJ/EryC1/StrS family aminotransferase [Candidatus Rokubacteria bacterium]|nr:DegT/DnrJ/EryC1/StrS family aminotransferase [Candidatus Rokubacteria bacterium]